MQERILNCPISLSYGGVLENYLISHPTRAAGTAVLQGYAARLPAAHYTAGTVLLIANPNIRTQGILDCNRSLSQLSYVGDAQVSKYHISCWIVDGRCRTPHPRECRSQSVHGSSSADFWDCRATRTQVCRHLTYFAVRSTPFLDQPFLFLFEAGDAEGTSRD